MGRSLAANSVRLGWRCKGLIPLEEVTGPKARTSRAPGTVRDHRPRGGHVSGLQADPAMARWVRAPVAEHVPRGVRASGPLYLKPDKQSAPADRRGVAALETRIRPDALLREGGEARPAGTRRGGIPVRRTPGVPRVRAR